MNMKWPMYISLMPATLMVRCAPFSSFTVKVSPTETLSISASRSEITSPLLTSICGWCVLRSRNVRYSLKLYASSVASRVIDCLSFSLPAVFDSSS